MEGIYKFHGGIGAKLCNKCACVLRAGNTLTKRDRHVIHHSAPTTSMDYELCKKCWREEREGVTVGTHTFPVEAVRERLEELTEPTVQTVNLNEEDEDDDLDF